jgi:hypothetical protein
MARAQQIPKTQLETVVLVKNYEVIIKQSKGLDPRLDNENLRQLHHLVFTQNIPHLEAQFTSMSQELQVCVDRLKQLEIPNIEAPSANSRHESPLLLHLYLAMDTSHIQLSRDQEQGRQKWGRLSAFPGYLGQLAFTPYMSEVNGKYWPGLPSCLMTSFPVSATREKSNISLAASLDKVGSVTSLSSLYRTNRHVRWTSLKNSCDTNTKQIIEATETFSKTLRDIKKWETLFIKTRGLSFKNWEPHHLRSHAHVPVYLPIVAATWTPTGVYKPACALDSIRFRFLRPPEAEKTESALRWETDTDPNVPTFNGCAEWDGFISIMAQQKEDEILTWY